MEKIILPTNEENVPPLMVRKESISNDSVVPSPVQTFILKQVSPTDPSKFSIAQVNSSSSSNKDSNIQLTTTADGNKLFLSNLMSPSNTSVDKQFELNPICDLNYTNPTTSTLSPMPGKSVHSIKTINAPETSKPIILRIPGLNQPVIVKQSSLGPPIVNSEQLSKTDTDPSVPSTSDSSTTSGTSQVLYLKSRHATYKVVGKPIPIKLHSNLPKNAPNIISSSSSQSIPVSKPEKMDNVTSSRQTPVSRKIIHSSEPPAYLNIRINEKVKDVARENEVCVNIKEEVEESQDEMEIMPTDICKTKEEAVEVIDSMLDVKIKEEPEDDQSGELLEQNKQLDQVLGGNSDKQQSKFFIRTSEGKLVTISPKEALALGLDHMDKVENNQKRLIHALNMYKDLPIRKDFNLASVVSSKEAKNILIPDDSNLKDYVSCHVSPAAEKTAKIMKKLKTKSLETNKNLFSPQSNTTVLGEYTESGQKYLRVQIENEFNEKDVCNVKMTPFNTYQCPFCLKQFKIKDHVISHLRTHTGERPYPCEICGKRYRQRIDIIRHMRIHTGEKPFTCELCNASFNQKSNLRSHMRIHTGERPVQCKVCGKGFSRNTHLKQHMKLHTGEKPFLCKVCYRPFRFKSGLQAHERIHSGLKPYACSMCGRTFTQIVGVLRHQRTHIGEKPFRCQSCGKSFDNRETLKTHVLKHTSVRPFVCDICSKTFTDKSSLRCHYKKYHGNNLMCVICLREDFKDRIELREHLRAHERSNWEETPDGDLIPIRNPKPDHFISVDDTLENVKSIDDEMEEIISLQNNGIENIKVEVNLEPDDPMENDDDSDCEKQEYRNEHFDPLA